MGHDRVSWHHHVADVFKRRFKSAFGSESLNAFAAGRVPQTLESINMDRSRRLRNSIKLESAEQLATGPRSHVRFSNVQLFSRVVRRDTTDRALNSTSAP